MYMLMGQQTSLSGSEGSTYCLCTVIQGILRVLPSKTVCAITAFLIVRYITLHTSYSMPKGVHMLLNMCFLCCIKLYFKAVDLD